MKNKIIISILIASLALSGCSAANNADDSNPQAQSDTLSYTCDEGDAHAIEADGTTESYSGISVTKTGDSEGDEADFYGSNAAVFATNGATLDIKDAKISTDGTHANAVFSYGEGTTVNISDSTIETNQSTSGGVMVTGGGTLNATNLNVTTQSGSSAPIRSDRGGGTLNVTGGTYESNGIGSPAIYSTAVINVENATLNSNVSEAVVVEGKNSVTIKNSDVTGNNTDHNSDKADLYRNVMIYQSMSGDAAEGKGEFTMSGGSLTAKNGAMFFVTNTVADINLENVELGYASDELLRIEKAGWGNDGSNGGNVNLNATSQKLEGIISVDEISALNMYLKNGSEFKGSIVSSGDAYVEIEDGSTWTLTADSKISGLTCGENAINLNGFTLTVDGKEYTEGAKSEGTAIEFKIEASQNMGQMPPMDGSTPPAKPDGQGEPPKDGGTPPAKPDGQGEPPQGGTPPAKPDNTSSSQ